jgi:putative ubiquitin-RnfH superfamily antitoxin RatB of RatAB toxin-antitoxin module
MAATDGKLHVVICYATAQQEILRELWVEPGMTVGGAIATSNILQELGLAPDPALYPTGIFGKKRPPDTVLRDGDRVELYRPLLADPKESRRRRAGGKAVKGD